MAHPNLHAKSSAKKFGGKPEDYIHLHEWLDETKSWLGDSLHRMFRHHSEGIFEMEKRFGPEVKRLRYLPVTEYGAGSTPVRTARGSVEAHE